MKKLITGFVALATAAAMALPAFAVADNDRGEKNDHDQREARMLGSTLEVHINDNGTVLVRGAKVTAVSGNSITAVSSWGSTTLVWTVNVDANTQFVRRSGGASNVGEVTVGDSISFHGSLLTNSNGLVVSARVVKDWSLQPKHEPRVFKGTLKTPPGAIAPTSMVVTIRNVDYTVNVAANVSVLNRLWLMTSLNNLRVGDRIRLYGTLDGTTITASVVRDTSI